MQCQGVSTVSRSQEVVTSLEKLAQRLAVRGLVEVVPHVVVERRSGCPTAATSATTIASAPTGTSARWSQRRRVGDEHPRGQQRGTDEEALGRDRAAGQQVIASAAPRRAGAAGTTSGDGDRAGRERGRGSVAGERTRGPQQHAAARGERRRRAAARPRSMIWSADRVHGERDHDARERRGAGAGALRCSRPIRSATWTSGKEERTLRARRSRGRARTPGASRPPPGRSRRRRSRVGSARTSTGAGPASAPSASSAVSGHQRQAEVRAIPRRVSIIGRSTRAGAQQRRTDPERASSASLTERRAEDQTRRITSVRGWAWYRRTPVSRWRVQVRLSVRQSTSARSGKWRR